MNFADYDGSVCLVKVTVLGPTSPGGQAGITSTMAGLLTSPLKVSLGFSS